MKVNRNQLLEEQALKQTHGSGNGQARYIPDEYVQARMLKGGVGK
ncbi:hypothetical protein [Enterococcus sp. RIT-PI-f]|nr:hypothetical protein [Enterococcus sp. RIT-PI-f]